MKAHPEVKQIVGAPPIHQKGGKGEGSPGVDSGKRDRYKRANSKTIWQAASKRRGVLSMTPGTTWSHTQQTARPLDVGWQWWPRFREGRSYRLLGNPGGERSNATIRASVTHATTRISGSRGRPTTMRTFSALLLCSTHPYSLLDHDHPHLCASPISSFPNSTKLHTPRE